MALSRDDLFRPFHEAIKPPDRWRIGAEAEKFGVITETGAALPYDGERGITGIFAALQQRGWTAVSEVEGGPILALTRDGASVTLEPGGQLELSGAPLADVHAIAAETNAHLAELHSITDPLGISWLGVGFHPFARQEDLSWVPKLRYAIMREYLPTRGNRAVDMMRRTATVQANFDYGSEEDAMLKMRVALRLSVIVTAMFANSPFYEGRLTGERSERAKVWLAVDPDRQGLLPALWKADSSFADYVEWALDVPMFLIKRNGKVIPNTGQTFRTFWKNGYQGETADIHDWELHINTLFPEVRLKHTIEVRGNDSQSVPLAAAIPAIFTGILYDAAALEAAEKLTASFTFDEMQSLRPEVAKLGLAAKLRGKPVADTAQAMLGIAKQGLARRARRAPDGQDETVYLAPLESLAARAQCPADRLLADFPADPSKFKAEVIRRTKL
ncbi:MAG TPA: glutamate-cysteine ligase family protein [Polyangiaceae bacterium]|jgi:glutamate--cysteine ligase|nr:glutamate-cysteine ligase family protein [Polyangiaceae bacterium]